MIFDTKIFSKFEVLIIEAAIIAVFNSRLFNDFCKRYGGDNHEDLKSEVMLIICELPNEKKENIVRNDYLLPYALNIIRNQVSTKKWTQWRKKYENRLPVIPNDFLVFRDRLGFNDAEYFGDVWQQSDNWYGADRMVDELDPVDLTNEKILKKVKDDSLNQNNEYFYHSRVLLESMKYRNVKKTAEAIGIPYKSVLRNLNDYKEALKEWAEAR